MSAMLVLKKHQFHTEKTPKQLESILKKRIHDRPMEALSNTPNGFGWLGGADHEGFGFHVIKRERIMPLPKIRAAIVKAEKGSEVHLEARPSPFALFYLFGFIVFGVFMAFNSKMGTTALMIPILPLIICFFAYEALQKTIEDTIAEIETLLKR